MNTTVGNSRSILRSHRLIFGLLVVWALCMTSCGGNSKNPASSQNEPTSLISPTPSSVDPDTALFTIVVNRDIKMKAYFPFMDSVVRHYDSLVAYDLTEHLLVRANPWIIDTLSSYDYDLRMPKGQFIADQNEEVMLKNGDTILVPNDTVAAQLQNDFQHTILDVNIPEYKLRIFQGDTVLHTFSVRVGRNEEKFLGMAGRIVSLRTPIGEGEIVRIEKNPTYMNPVDGEKYFATHRDDGKLTKLPQIPFLEPSINGQRPGSLIHPTTNPHTLGKAYSNGCVGTRESAAWVIYYYAPVGTKVRFRYDLDMVDEAGDTLVFKDIYHLQKGHKSKKNIEEQPTYFACWIDTLADGSVVHICR
jgi:L,D-transpeptidase ErfK/SrfK